MYNLSSYFTINGQGENSPSNNSFYDEFRISSIARWIKDFIPPKRPYIKLNKIFLDKPNFIYGITNKI